jgi:hypothetical protein
MPCARDRPSSDAAIQCDQAARPADGSIDAELHVSKRLRILMILLAAGGLPYAWFSDQVRVPKHAMSDVLAMLTSDATPRARLSDRAPADRVPSELEAQSQHPVPQPPLSGQAPAGTDPLREVLRMDVTHEWVTRRWPRVSTVRADVNLLGMRVAYVSGTRLDDIAGSLTYYFDSFGRVRRITLHGRTGDASRLLSVAAETFQLRSEPNLRAGLYVARWNGAPASALWISHAEVVRADEPHWRYEIKLEINRPDLGYQLSRELAAILEHDFHSTTRPLRGPLD